MTEGRAGGSAPFTFRVSDVVEVPLRGTMLRLRVIDGHPAMSDLKVGGRLELRAPTGERRSVAIAAHALTGGRPTQARLDRTRELDIVVRGGNGDDPAEVGIGWTAHGPVNGEG